MADDRLGGRRTPREPRDTTGRTPFIWVQDDKTGHRYDVAEPALRPGMTPVEGVEKNWTGKARTPKFRTDLAGQSAQPTGTASDGTPTDGSGEPAEKPAATDDAGKASTKGTRR